jgi:hypothetical protein
LVFLLISTHLTAPLGIPLFSTSLNLNSFSCGSNVKHWNLTRNLIRRLRISLRPVNPDNARTPRITDASGTWLAGTYSLSTLKICSTIKGVYNPRIFILHAVSRRQTFVHCARFLVAASRRSLGRISVPVWLAILSDQLPVIGLVGNYPTNNLIGRGPILNCKSFTLTRLSRITPPFGGLCSGSGEVPTCYSAVCHYQFNVLLH